MQDETSSAEQNRRLVTGGVWHKCKECKEIVVREDFEAALFVCPACDHHFGLESLLRINSFVDKGSFCEEDATLCSTNPLQFYDRKDYGARLAELQNKLQKHDALLAGSAKLDGMPIKVAAFDFSFLGGSMGAVVGEKIKRLFQQGAEERCPVIIFSASGGARMQEGLVSLLQMAKTCSALTLLQEKRVPFISVLTHPTTGGVAASFAMLGDVNIAEPNALIGFAGPRVIEQTIREKLPIGFQRSEYLLERGMIDMICHRSKLQETVTDLLALLYKR